MLSVSCCKSARYLSMRKVRFACRVISLPAAAAAVISAMDKNGIGTDATMHTHIDTILQRNYASKDPASQVTDARLEAPRARSKSKSESKCQEQCVMYQSQPTP